jgi:hypothetical protein
LSACSEDPKLFSEKVKVKLQESFDAEKKYEQYKLRVKDVVLTRDKNGGFSGVAKIQQNDLLLDSKFSVTKKDGDLGIKVNDDFLLQNFKTDISGKWSAFYRSWNNDGHHEENLIIQKTSAGYEVLHWEDSACTSGEKCRDVLDSDSYGKIVRYESDSIIDILSKVYARIQGGKIVINDHEEEYQRSDFKGHPSFSCTASKLGPREAAICGDARLRFLDTDLAVNFKQALTCIRRHNGVDAEKKLKELADQLGWKTADRQKELRMSQANWWRDELSKCDNATCVPSLYRARIEFLQKMCD